MSKEKLKFLEPRGANVKRKKSEVTGPEVRVFIKEQERETRRNSLG